MLRRTFKVVYPFLDGFYNGYVFKRDLREDEPLTNIHFDDFYVVLTGAIGELRCSFNYQSLFHFVPKIILEYTIIPILIE